MLRRLRLRQAAGRTFADVVIGVSPGAAVGQGHDAADRVEAAVQRVLPASDIVVHVEPTVADGELRERVRAAAMTVSHVRELHDVTLIDTDDGIEASLHLKLPGELALDEAHAIAEEVERAIHRDVPEIRAVQTHLEPLADTSPGRRLAHDPAEAERAVVESRAGCRGSCARSRRARASSCWSRSGSRPTRPSRTAHDQASAVSRRIRESMPDVADVVVHTEP